MLIVCESIEHPDFPEQNNKWRVKNYWSYIVIRPHEDFDKVRYLQFVITFVSNILSFIYSMHNINYNF